MSPWWYSDRRRTWYFTLPAVPAGQTRSEEEAAKEIKSWREAFETSCQGASMPTEVEDPVMRLAFEIALEKTRWESGVWGWYCWFGSESDRLCEFIFQLCEQEILNSALSNVGPAFMAHRICNFVKSTVRNGISAACKPAISAALAAAGPVITTISEFLAKGLEPIFEAEQGVINKVITIVSETARPTVEGLGKDKLSAIMSAMFIEIEKAFVAGIKGWHTKMMVKAEGYTNDEHFQQIVVKQTERYLDYWWSENILDESIRILYDMDNVSNPLYRYKDCLPPPLSFWDLYWMSRDTLKLLMRNAILTLKNAKPGNNAECKAAVENVTGKLVHDAKVVLRQLLVQLLRRLLIWFVEELVIKPAKKLIEPVVETVAALPPPINQLFDLNAILVEVVDGILVQCLGNLVDASIQSCYAAIDAAGKV